jgi:SAM-dependent methyltransferase
VNGETAGVGASGGTAEAGGHGGDRWAETHDTVRVARRHVSDSATVRANLSWWDANADDYQAEHGDFLGDARFVWCPEGLDEADAHILGGDLAGRRILEIGCGAAQCSRWLIGEGARAVASDLSQGQLAHSVQIDTARVAAGYVAVPLVQADATRLPFASGAFDIVCSAYGAVPFVADSAAVMREAARVLKPGGTLAFSVTHPIRWSLPDDPGEAGLTIRDSYFDRRPYAEFDDNGTATYAEHHRTLGDRIREIAAAGLTLVDLVEPEWPENLDSVWGGWSPLRGRLIPGTAIFVAVKG